MSRYRRVVLVDDNVDDNFVNSYYLQRAGWASQVECYAAPEDALAEIPAQPVPEVLFVDLNMPGMSGFELLDALAQTDVDLSETQVIVLTSSVHPEDRRRAENAGVVDAYVEKPLDEATLKRLAEEIDAPGPRTPE